MIGEESFIENIYVEKLSSVDELYETGTRKICNISQSFCKVEIDCCKVFKNCKSKYIIIKGRKLIKTHYIGDDRCGAIQSKVFIYPLFVTIPIEYCKEIEICKVKNNIDYFEIKRECNNKYYAYSIITITVEAKQCKCKYNYKDNTEIDSCDFDNKCAQSSSLCANCEDWEIKNDEIDCWE